MQRKFVRLWLLFLLLSSIQSHNAVLIGAGATMPQALYKEAAFGYQFVKQGAVEVQYSGMSSRRGLCRIMDPSNACELTDTEEPKVLDFAGSDSLLHDVDYKQYPDLQMYPTAALAVVPIYNLGMDVDLTLSPSLLARIFSGQVQTWDDPAILACNPDFMKWNIPPHQRIELVVYSHDTGLNEVFTKALSSFDPMFSQLVNVSSKPSWGNISVTLKNDCTEALAYIAVTWYTIGYSSLTEALDGSVPFAQMQTEKGIVQASTQSIGFAVLERGVDFGNNGDPPERLTADLHGVQGSHAWPICSYTYLVVRKETTAPGRSCSEVHQLVDFWQWFWRSATVEDMTVDHSLGPLPSAIRDIVLQRFLGDIKCAGQQVWDGGDGLIPITISGPMYISRLFAHLKQMYGLVESRASLQYIIMDVDGTEAMEKALDKYMVVASRQVPRPPIAGGATVAVAAVGVLAISTMRVALDGRTLAMILEGTITKWLHPAIQALNPGGIQDPFGALLTDEKQNIVLLKGPYGLSASLLHLMGEYLPGFTGKELLASQEYGTEEELRLAVTQTLFALSVTPMTGDFEALPLVQFRGPGGQVVAPSWQAIQSCAAGGKFNSNSFANSNNPSCYPFAEVVHLTVKRSRCNLSTDTARTATVAFIEWLLYGSFVDTAMEQENFAPLRSISKELTNDNEAAWQSITCDAHIGTSFLITIGVAVGVLVPFIIAGAAYWWYATRELRAMRQRFSNDNVAQECAEAIARFDLDSVAWLNKLAKPNKIQQSFIRIIRLLTEVKPYIPDQLLSALTEVESKDIDCLAPFAKKPISEPSVRHAESCLSDSRKPSTARGSCPAAESECSVSNQYSARTGTQGSAAHLTSVLPPGERANFGLDWVFKRCTYMQIRFGCPKERDSKSVMDPMSHVAAKLIIIGKSYGATIDKVAHDTLTLHWGLVGARNSAPLQATSAALDMKTVCTLLPPELEQDFYLRIGIGTGLCATATLSAAGHRFFIINGRQVNIASDIVLSDEAAALGCEVFISNDTFKEVRYNVKCSPRLWFHGTELLWEPVQLREHVIVADEWMYELRQLEETEDEEFTGESLFSIFQMVRRGETRAAVEEQVQRLKARHGDTMSPQDIKSLDHLLATMVHGSFRSI